MSSAIDLIKKEWAEAAAKDTWRANAVPANSITAKAIHWLWQGWIAFGKLTILAGAGGTGKTTLAIWLVAILTKAGRWPDGATCGARRSVIFWSSEDDAADTLVPRMEAAGADTSKVYILQGRINGLGEIEPFDPAKDVDLLAAELERIGDVGLILIDPIVSAVAGDMHRANDVRRALQGLVNLAEQFDCAVLGITHFSKGSAGSNPAERVLGSQAFGALARTVLVAAKQEDSDRRVLARAKSNISIDDGGCSYSIEECTIGDGIVTTRVVWGERIEGSAREILADVESSGDDEQRTEIEEACDFLRDTLRHGSVPTKQVKADASDAGLSWATVRRAQKVIGATAVKEGGRIGSEKQQWVWSLSVEGAQKTQKVLTEKSEHLLENVSTFCESPVPPFDESDAEEL